MTDEIDISRLEKLPIQAGKKPVGKAKVELLNEEQRIEAAYQAISQKDFLGFCRGLTIESQEGPRVFENCMAPFQRLFFEEIEPSLAAVRAGQPPETRRWWLERTKKASKDADLAIICLWLIAFPLRPFFMQVGAADSEQANIVKDRMSHLLHWNPWLNKYVQMVNNEVRSVKKLENGKPMATLVILSSDIAGAHGGTPDVLIINELSHITKWEFAQNLMDNADGVKQGLAIIATNAGYKGTKAEVWRNNALTNNSWCVHVFARPAPWHDKETIEDARRRNTNSRFQRLWWGKWPSGKGDALDEESIEKCFCLQGPISKPRNGLVYIGGLDLGVSHDHSGLVFVEVDYAKQLVKLAYQKAWKPQEDGPEKGKVDLIDVEAVSKQMFKHYNAQVLLYDPSQAELMGQRLRRVGVNAREMSFQSGSNITDMAEALMQLLKAGKLMCYDVDGRLRRDFGKFNVVERPYGYRLEAVSDEFGHADVGTALVITLPMARDILNGLSDFSPDDELTPQDDSEFEEKELKTLPKEFQELFSGEDEQNEKSHFKGRKRPKVSDPFEDLF